MKTKSIFILLAMMLSLTVAAADKESRIVFTELSYDFGNIAEDGGPVSHSFNFSNDGDAPLVIVSAKASCGCTRPQYPLRPIEAGKSSTIKVTFLPEGRPGEFVKEVKVQTNDKQHKTVKLKISGIVLPKK